MIIITATVRIRAEHHEEALAFARRHVATSRLEEGCLSHRFFEDPEHDRTLVFFEEWQDQAAIDRHFAQPHSGEFVKAFRAWCEGGIALELHHVSNTNRIELGA
ncbi:MAG TPA: antibiotic biosynthesis monooxygenase [Deltaproteobacteria bacterium]|nr:antibiotic biosynthesis monooxygenase [Deltaproteobacteria bacterium]